MSKSIKSVYDGFPTLDKYGECLITEDTAQFIVDALAKRNVVAMRMFVGRSTIYQMVFLNMAEARSFLGFKPFSISQNLFQDRLSWTGGGNLYVGIERKGGFAFNLSNCIYSSYVAEKLMENCNDIAENIADLLNMIAERKPSGLLGTYKIVSKNDKK